MANTRVKPSTPRSRTSPTSRTAKASAISACTAPVRYTWQAEDLYDEQKKFMAFPNMRVTSGYAFSHENGGEEIAEVTISFKAMKDELGNFYYEAYENELTDESVKTGWAQTFDQSLVELVTP